MRQAVGARSPSGRSFRRIARDRSTPGHSAGGNAHPEVRAAARVSRSGLAQAAYVVGWPALPIAVLSTTVFEASRLGKLGLDFRNVSPDIRGLAKGVDPYVAADVGAEGITSGRCPLSWMLTTARVAPCGDVLADAPGGRRHDRDRAPDHGGPAADRACSLHRPATANSVRSRRNISPILVASPARSNMARSGPRPSSVCAPGWRLAPSSSRGRMLVWLTGDVAQARHRWPGAGDSGVRAAHQAAVHHARWLHRVRAGRRPDHVGAGAYPGWTRREGQADSRADAVAALAALEMPLPGRPGSRGRVDRRS